MQTLTDFILKFAGIKAADGVAFKNAAQGKFHFVDLRFRDSLFCPIESRHQM